MQQSELTASQVKVCFITMGCAKNEVDTAAMKKQLRGAGFSIIDDPEEARVIIVNTCSFIQSATEESLEAIFDAAELPHVASGEARIIVAGCMPARYGDDLETELTEASAFVPCSREDDIVEVVARCSGVDVPEDEVISTGASLDQGPTFAYVKISDGCDRWCSYCTIPLIRGRYHSFPYEQIRAHVAEHVANGIREIDLIAQDTGRWGTDFEEEQSLSWLMDTLAGEFPETWFRVMYLQPEGVTDDLLQVMKSHDNICSYLDIPLQHVCEPVLRAMNRRGSREEFEALIAHIRNVIPNITLRTTLIAGFPGETEEQFEELCDFVEECDFDYIGVFPYSREEGAKSYDLPNQLEEEEKAERAQRVRDIADAFCSQKVARRIGSMLDILIEGVEEDGQLYGRAQCQAPEVDGVTYIEQGHIGEIVRVKIADTLLYEMEGE